MGTMTYLTIIFGYLLIVWVGLRVFVPHLGFRKSPLPAELPVEFAVTIKRMNAEAADDFDFLKRSYEFVTSRYRGSRVRTLLNFWVAFEDPINHAPGFLPCTGQNHILRTMLIKSGRFSEEDIQLHVVPFNIFLHQYLRVRVGGKWVDADPWSAFRGLSLGQKSAFVG